MLAASPASANPESIGRRLQPQINADDADKNIYRFLSASSALICGV